MLFDPRSGVNDYRAPHEVFYNQDIALACDLSVWPKRLKSLDDGQYL